MDQEWITYLLLAFGISVAIAGVAAFLKLYYKEKQLSSSSDSADITPSPNVVNVELEAAEEVAVRYEQKN